MGVEMEKEVAQTGSVLVTLAARRKRGKAMLGKHFMHKFIKRAHIKRHI